MFCLEHCCYRWRYGVFVCLHFFLLAVETYDEKKEKIAFNQFAVMVVGAGGFQGAKKSAALKTIQNPPERAPDASMAEKTSVDQVR